MPLQTCPTCAKVDDSPLLAMAPPRPVDYHQCEYCGQVWTTKKDSEEIVYSPHAFVSVTAANLDRNQQAFSIPRQSAFFRPGGLP